MALEGTEVGGRDPMVMSRRWARSAGDKRLQADATGRLRMLGLPRIRLWSSTFYKKNSLCMVSSDGFVTLLNW